MAHLVLIASYTNEVYTVAFDPTKGTVDLVSSVTVGHHPSWITAHPEDNSIIFTGLEQSDGKVLVLKYDVDGKGTVVAQGPSGGADPCSLLAIEDRLFIANYSAGVIASYPISKKAPYLLASTPSTLQLQGSGPNSSRQESSHPHQVIIHDPTGELLVPDLGSDKVHRFDIAADGNVVHRGHVDYVPGGGPRHLAFHDGKLYTVLELTSELAKHNFPPLPAAPSFVASTPTLSKPLPTPNDMLASEIIIPPPNVTFPTPHLYLSNRNDPSSDGDIISIFSITNPDKLELITEVRTGLTHVRGMLFGGLDDRWLIAGGTNGGGIKVFERVDGGRNLKVVAENKNIGAPTGFLWL